MKLLHALILLNLLSVSLVQGSQCNCGKPVKKIRNFRISHGVTADTERYPWIVYLEIRLSKGFSLCTSSLLDHRHVLTAAHCILQPEDVSKKPDRLSVYVGNDKTNPMKVARTYIHKSYKIGGAGSGSDIAVLRLKQSRPDLTPVCLPSNPWDRYIGHRAVAVGFGVDENDNLTEKLMKVPVKILSNKQCNIQRWWNNNLKG